MVQLDVAEEDRKQSSFWLKRGQKKGPSSGRVMPTHHHMLGWVFDHQLPHFTPMALLPQPARHTSLSQSKKQRLDIYSMSIPELAVGVKMGFFPLIFPNLQGNSLSQSPQSIFRTSQIHQSLSGKKKKGFLSRSSNTCMNILSGKRYS